MGKPWKFSRLEPSNWLFEIIDGMGRGFILRPEKDRLKICGMFPRHKCTPCSSDYQTIGVSVKRHVKRHRRRDSTPPLARVSEIL
jgi:hypothetical protein